MRISQNLSSFYRPLKILLNARIEQVIFYLGRMAIRVSSEKEKSFCEKNGNYAKKKHENFMKSTEFLKANAKF